MKVSKRFKRITLIIIVVMIALSFVKVSYGEEPSTMSILGDYFASDEFFTLLTEGVAGILLRGIQQLAILVFGALQALTIAITGVSGEGYAGSIGDVLFNRVGLTSANFFPSILSGEAASDDIITNIAQYYNLIRVLSIALSLFVLVYCGIRMAISTVADDKAKYNKMFTDWVISLILVFVLHYIIIITFVANDTLVKALESADPNPDASVWGSLWLNSWVPGAGVDDLIVYGAFTIANLAFVLTYIKRTIVLALLIVISPLITVTYAIDKIGDGKSQALNTWLREFISTVLIQPFHCIIYIVFYGSIMSNLTGLGEHDLGKMIFASASALFMLKAENIVKKIFGIQPNSMGDAMGTAAMAVGVATSMFKGGNSGKGGKFGGKGDMPTMKNNESISKAEEQGTAGNGGTPPAGGGGTPPAGGGGTPPAGDGGTPPAGGGGTPPAGGGGTPPAGSGGTPPAGGGGTPPAGGGGTPNTPSKLDKFLDLSRSSLAKDFKRRGGWAGFASRKISGAATLAGAIAGGAVGDMKTMASTATAAGSVGKNIGEHVTARKNERQLEKNQEVFAGAYNDFAEEYKKHYAAENGGAEPSEEDIMAEAKRIYDTGGQGLEGQYEKDFYSQMEQMARSAEVTGFDDGFDFVTDSMRLAQEGVIEPPKDYKQKKYN